MENLNKIKQTLKNNDNFLITSHVNPDGDAMGSMSALGHLLQTMGKKFSIFNESQVPDRFNWINLPGPVEDKYQPGNHSWMIVLDCGDFDRSGKQLLGNATEPIINIDHHRGNPGFGQINWVDTQASSVGEMIADLADNLQVKINGPLAEGIYLALVSDTGFFTFGNTSPKVLELSARLIRNGLNPGILNSVILNQWTIGRLRLHGLAMQKTLFFIDDRVGIVSISQQMMEETGTGPDDCEGLVNMIRNVRSVEVAISLREDEPGKIKFSLRSTGDIDVQLMAAELQGGGHKNASGGTVQGSIEYARDRIIDVVARHLES